MARLQTIVLVGQNPPALREALQAAGFTGDAGFQLIEVADISSAAKEMKLDQSVIALATCVLDNRESLIALAKEYRLVRAVGDPSLIPRILTQQLEFAVT